MKVLTPLKLIFLIFIFNFQNNYSQTSIGLDTQFVNMGASGGNLKSDKGSVSFSVGQVFFHYLNNSQTTILAGVQQPVASEVFLGTEKPEHNVSILAYPNPITDFLILEIKDFNNPNITYTIFDQNGSRVQHEVIKTGKTKIACQRLQAAAYFVIIMNNNKLIKTFKLLKT
ncbi:T9SS type A sorting domain-containing protein [Leeuwenhoekiella polynyae]|uniref:Putative secreted protein (Por secretion system target) n=1 Tax=Leeuwenhoekiella polynyae TaxID=1550906 RepID=A0A4Q0PH89_9FLAO|nr:T9SS type A sorting domain-containing protein [Leeuwenhoekiella polynyae]RXG25599.1 putative secreted protein (Por secretion system target) [Leeuwenhoekiella polynyae]